MDFFGLPRSSATQHLHATGEYLGRGSLVLCSSRRCARKCVIGTKDTLLIVTPGSSQSTLDSSEGLLCAACLTCLSLKFSRSLCLYLLRVISTVMFFSHPTLDVPCSCSQHLARCVCDSNATILDTPVGTQCSICSYATGHNITGSKEMQNVLAPQTPVQAEPWLVPRMAPLASGAKVSINSRV